MLSQFQLPNVPFHFPEMGSHTLILILSLYLSLSTSIHAQGIKSARLLDLIIRDITLKSYNSYIRTGTVESVILPSNFTGVNINTAKFRCGSLTRYGAKIKQFRLGIGVIAHPCVERVLFVSLNLGNNWSQLYYENYNLVGYKLISPVLGLLVYNAGDKFDFSSNNPFEISIISRKKLVTVDFTNVTMYNKSCGSVPLCATFGHDGKVLLSREVAPNICAASGKGHFGMVVEWPDVPRKNVMVRRWKVAVGATAGAGLGFLLLGLLVVAIFLKVKKKGKMEMMEMRGHEEESLRVVTMVGHVRAHFAHFTRTNPSIEHGRSVRIAARGCDPRARGANPIPPRATPELTSGDDTYYPMSESDVSHGSATIERAAVRMDKHLERIDQQLTSIPTTTSILVPQAEQIATITTLQQTSADALHAHISDVSAIADYGTTVGRYISDQIYAAHPHMPSIGRLPPYPHSPPQADPPTDDLSATLPPAAGAP